MCRRTFATALIATCGIVSPALAQMPPTDRQREYLNFIKTRAEQIRTADKPPATREQWEERRADIRKHLQQAFGPFPAGLGQNHHPAPADAHVRIRLSVYELHRFGHSAED